jgi:hypothetical protein
MPIYLVNQPKSDAPVRVIEADNRTQALRHVAEATFKVDVASATDVARALSSGTVLENATKQQRELPEVE